MGVSLLGLLLPVVIQSTATNHVKTEEGLLCRYTLTESTRMVIEPMGGMCPDKVRATGTWAYFKRSDGICWYVPPTLNALIGRKTEEACTITLEFGEEGVEL